MICTAGRSRRVGLVHAVANSAALVCYTASWAQRRRGRHGSGVAWGWAGAAAATTGGFLGGHLVNALGVGVDNTVFDEADGDWSPADSLGDGRGPVRAVDAAGVAVDQLAEGNGHLLLDGGGVVDVAGDTEELSTGVTLATERVEPASTATDDRGGDSNGLDVGNSGRATEETNGSREWGLQTGLAGLALKRLNERCLLTADVCAHTTVEVDVEVVAGATGVLTDKTSLVSFLNGALKNSGLVVELTTDVDVRSGALE